MPTQQQINLAAYKSGKKPEEIQRLLQEKQGIVSAPPIQTTIAPAPTIQPSQVNAPTWATYAEQNILSPNVTGFTKPVIATKDAPVISTPSAVGTLNATFDLNTAKSYTSEQIRDKYYELGTKLQSEYTDDDRKWSNFLKTKANLEYGGDISKMIGANQSRSSGTTTYSTELVQPWENIASSVRNTDWTYKVTYKDGTTQTTTTEPSTTVFPEWTPEYYAQKNAEAGAKRIADLEAQAAKAEEKRKKDTEELVKKYGENIATQFQNQKAEIESNGAKRMETLNSWLSFSGFWRSTLALEKRDEIAKNIEATINQAKAKADLELMAYRMEREGADAEAISAMRKNIADVQQRIDDANYANQLKIIELNQQNATSGAEAMNNLLATISNGDEIASNADIEKSQQLGYFVNKDGSPMLDSQKRPIQFEGNAGSLDPSAIGAYADALKKGIIGEKALDKLSPNDKAAVLKHVAVQDGTYTAPVSVSDFIAKEEWFRDKAYWDVNGWAVGYGQHAINGKPVVEWQTIDKATADKDLANRVANARFNKLITVPLSESQKAALYSLEHNVGGGVWQLASIKPMIEAINKWDFNLAANILVQSGVGTRNAATQEVLGGLVARRQREADLLRQSGGGGGGQAGLSEKSIELQNIINLVDTMLQDEEALKSISGWWGGRIPWSWLFADQLAVNQFNQLKWVLSLWEREKLKGTGAISDFEMKMLAESASALGRNLSEEDFKKELEKIRDVLSWKYKYLTGDVNTNTWGQTGDTQTGWVVDWVI